VCVCVRGTLQTFFCWAEVSVLACGSIHNNYRVSHLYKKPGSLCVVADRGYFIGALFVYLFVSWCPTLAAWDFWYLFFCLELER
jgi:hypothetical protein